MKYLWVFAHPEPRSLNASLRDEAVDGLRADGHAVVVSDLYQMDWDPVVRRSDYAMDSDTRFNVGRESAHAHAEDRLSKDIAEEQRKIMEADMVLLQFPLWWYSMPAILKGWVDRVFVKGFAYGVQDPDDRGRTLRYGEGTFAGKRAMVVTTAGGTNESFGRRGVNGDIMDLLFPIHHGILWYTGMLVVEPVVVPAANHLPDDDFRRASAELHARAASMAESPTIPFRSQNSGDYDENLVLHEHLAAGEAGFGVHLHE